MRKNRKQASGPASHPVSLAPLLLVWGVVIAVGALRFSVASGGALTGQEAMILACTSHPAGGYVEGGAGLPLLLTLFKMAGVSGIAAVRLIPVLATLLITWCAWWIGRRIAPHRPAVALWSIIATTLFPPVTLASLVMNGSAVSAALLLLAIVAGWRAAMTRGPALGAWTFCGITLGVATFFWLPAGVILLPALAYAFVRRGFREFPWRGSLLAMGFLLLGWVVPLAWNAKNRWIGLYGVANGWDDITFGSHHVSLGLIVLLGVLVIPWMALLAFRSRVWSIAMVVAALLGASVSALWLLLPATIPAGWPSPIGVRGVGELATMILHLRKERPDSKGLPPFVIASSPGLAALLGSRVAVDYPERPGSPPIYTAESPSMNSSYAFWPSYPDAVAAGKPDTLYTEEKSASPFLGRNGLYITTESKEELPQTITGAFGAVGLLKEVPIEIDGRTQMIRIYQCEDYHTLSL